MTLLCWIVLIIFKLLHIKLGDIVAPDCIVKVDELAQMSVYNESTVINTEFAFSCDFEANHAELVPGSCSRGVHIKVNLLDIQNYESGKSLFGAKSLEHVLPVVGAIDLVSTHGMSTNNMY